jgi:hypothetical protein
VHKNWSGVYVTEEREEILKLGKGATVQAFWPNRLAPETKEFLYAGLEEFVNVGNLDKDFRTFADKCPTFWPFDTQEFGAGLLRWIIAARPALNVFRDYLRKVWISDPEAHENAYLIVLLGLDVRFADEPEVQFWSSQRQKLHEAWAQLRRVHPEISIGIRPVLNPIWGLASFSYSPVNDFQKAVYQLFMESWRAKVCSRCSRYFIAQKPAQIYCSTKCSGEIKRARSLEWWRKEGAGRRRAAQKLSRRKKK